MMQSKVDSSKSMVFIRGLLMPIRFILKQILRAGQKMRILIMIYTERMQGLDLTKTDNPSRWNFDANIVFRGSPSGGKLLKNVMTDMNISCKDRLIDIGCSKGSAIRCISKFPFKNVDGIEVISSLAMTARNNMRKLNVNNCRIYNINAKEFKEFNKYNYFYLYNPFPEEVFDEVIRQITVQCKHEIKLIYNNPICHRKVLSYGFKLIKQYPSNWGNCINYYTRKASK